MPSLFFLLFLLLIIFSCKKEKASVPGKFLAEQLQGEWILVSETRTGNYENSRYEAATYEKLVYKNDGKVRSTIQGQVGGEYTYEPNDTDKTINFFFVSTHPVFLQATPCLPSVAGCLRRAKVLSLNSNLLVVGNSYTGTLNGSTFTITIVDSLRR